MSEQALWERQLKLTPSGGQTLSKLPQRYVDPIYPKLLSHGKGGHVWDVDGNEYIDLISGLGAVSVGYCNEYVNNAVTQQLHKGVSFSLPTTLEADVSEKLCRLFPGTEMWKYGKNGVDATLMAIRAARAYTGRNKILVHGYHGCSDHFEALGTRQAGMIDLNEYTERLDANTIVAEDKLDDYAAVIIEPYVFDEISWKYLRGLCRKHGIVFIVDEIVNGGRFPKFSAYAHLGLEPDLVCVGKGLANGFPLSAVGGRTEIMKTFERDDFFASTTFGGEAVSLAACNITLDILEKNLPALIAKGKVIKDSSLGIAKGYPTRLTFDFDKKADKALFMQEMCKRGILVGYSNMVMVDHTDEDIEKICDAIRDIAINWNSFKLEGSLPIEALRLRNR